MANVLGTLFTDIADSIRNKTGSTDKMSPSDFPSQIDSIQGGGGGIPTGYHSVTFMNGDNVLFERLVLNGDDCPDPVTQGRIETPTKESTVQYNYTYKGWSDTDGGTANSNVLKNITEDKVVYAAYTSTVREYTITYYDEDRITVLNTEQIAYGGSSIYTYEKKGHLFSGWTPSPTNIKGNLDCYGAWEEAVVEVAEITESWEDIIASINDGTYKSKYKVGYYKPLNLGSQGTVNMQIAAFNADILADGSGNAKTTWLATGKASTSKKMNVYAEQLYVFQEMPAWVEKNNVWTSQNRKVISDVKAKWIITATSEGTLSIQYKTMYSTTSYNKLSLVVNETMVATDYAGSSKTHTVDVAKGDTVIIEATFSSLTESETYATITFGSTGTFTTTAEIGNTIGAMADGYKEGTGAIGGWESCQMRAYYKDTLKPLIPEFVRNNIKEVRKITCGYARYQEKEYKTSVEDVWMPSYREMFGGTSYEQSGAMYTLLFHDDESRVKKDSWGYGYRYGLRSAYSYERFCLVSNSGAADNTYTEDYVGCILGFCI